MNKNFLDYTGLTKYTKKVEAFINDKLSGLVPKTRTVNNKELSSDVSLGITDVADAGDGTTFDGDTINLNNPTRGIMTQEEFDVLSEEEQNKGTYFVFGDNSADKDEPILPEIPVYGVEWDGNASVILTRTDAAAEFTDPVPAIGNGEGVSPFDTIMPWAGIVRVIQDGNELVAIPKYWLKVQHNPFRVQIANEPKEGFQVSPAHRDRGDGHGERDVVYVGRYECSSSFTSVSSVFPLNASTIAACRNGIHSLGEEYWQADFLLQLTLWYLYIVEFANFDSQSVIGKGVVNQNSSGSTATGATDQMIYHTGRIATVSNDKAPVQYRYIENLWGNVGEWRDGICFSANNICTYNNPSDFTSSYGKTGSITRSIERSLESGWITHFNYDLDDTSFIYPCNGNGSETTYVADHSYASNSGGILYVGGYNGNGTIAGLFCVNSDRIFNYTGSVIGCRLQKLPNN